MRSQSLFNRTYTNMSNSLQTATCSNHEIRHDTHLCSECTPLRIQWLRPTERHQMAGDNTSQNSVSRKCRWYTKGTYNWGIRGNYVKGHRAPVLQSGSFHCGSKRMGVCVCVCVCARARVRECVRGCMRESEREASWFACQSHVISLTVGQLTVQVTTLQASKGRFTHSLPCPCRSPAMPCR